ncbi:MAG: glycerol-3-phosphate dehydrogenase/oxidase [Acidimicrobiales bacterium]
MTTFERSTSLRRLAAETFDVLVIGGGITGGGVALDAASRGLRTALVERHDFSSGTSSKSSKLVHGGLRYLQNGDIRLVYEALHERQRLRKNAPHLVKLLPFLIPILGKGGVINPKIARALGSAMWLYDLTGGARIGKIHKRLNKAEVLEYMPTLPADALAGGYLYYDAQADDSRLTLTIVRTAVLRYNAVAVNGVSVTGITKDSDGRASGATVTADGESFAVRATRVINASGVWSDDVRALDEGRHPNSIRPAKGIHITVPWTKVRNTIAVVVPVPKDKRSVFVVPWGELTYIGTTDTDYDGPIDDPQCTAEDIEYLLRAINASVPDGHIETSDIVGTWAGLRPLVKAAASGRTADLSRRHSVQRSSSGVVSVIGGKLTTYREMAEDAVDAVIDGIGPGAPRGWKRCRTKKLALLGADGYDAVVASAGGNALLRHLADRYGDEAKAVAALIDAEASLGEPLVAGLPYVRAEAVHAARDEMARSVDDVLSRRTRARLLARDASAAAAESVAALIAPELGWTPAQAAASAAQYRTIIEHERAAATSGEPE